MAGAAHPQAIGHQVAAPSLTIGAAASSGAALLPDIDHPSLTVAGPSGRHRLPCRSSSTLRQRRSTTAHGPPVRNRGPAGTERSPTRPASASRWVHWLPWPAACGDGPPRSSRCSFLLGLSIRGLMGTLARHQGWAITIVLSAPVQRGAAVLPGLRGPRPGGHRRRYHATASAA